MMLSSGACKSLLFRPLWLQGAGRTLATSALRSAEDKSSSVIAPRNDEHHKKGLVRGETIESDVTHMEDFGLMADPMRPTGEVLVYEGPERDVVNFPRPTMPLYGGRTRLGFIPEEWFDFFYKKTGVTGPYVFGAGLITTLLSKELWIVDHEFPIIPPLALIIYLAMTKGGPALAKMMDQDIDEHERSLVELQEDNMADLKAAIQGEEQAQWSAKGQSLLFQAKRENVALQLEAEYRRRLAEAYAEVKKRLDYQVEVQNAKRAVERRHMVNWIINGVVKGIDERQEKQNIDNCIANLHRLSTA
ncbi:ATP synthase subunit b, mitochondrial-like [Paramacrobiotus metropolitanus]|uniref:ATP synthase subunit b, mitochondrial-like n=1 Tax=Paramacrobiotus metropolitanus TaxID=2943436 RepID=UPI0024461D02|nr:ATP synthase subunit b, mitochondrial-like [Paramacrobiotus metropolitanus]